MNNYTSLLFELSSVDRLDILELLRKNPLKLSHISRKLDFTVQETSRNVNRLLESGLITKNVDGTFSLSQYGEAAYGLLSGFRFLHKNKQYFDTHSTEQLPQFFKVGLGILDDFQLVDDVMIVFHDIEKMIKNAQEFVWILTDQILVSTIAYLIEGLQLGLQFRLMMPSDYLPSEEMRKLVSNPVFERASRNKTLETKFLDEVNVFVCLSENEVSALAFKTTEEKFDYRGFKTKTASAIEWTKILYTYYWNKSSSQLPNNLIKK
jgi:predicted transcriptional regulator